MLCGLLTAGPSDQGKRTCPASRESHVKSMRCLAYWNRVHEWGGFKRPDVTVGLRF